MAAAMAISGAGGEATTPVLAAYLPAWSFGAAPEASFGMVTDVLYFSVQPTEEGGVNTKDIEFGHLRALQEKKKRHGFRLLLCVGGWERSEHFAGVSADEGKRGRFVKELTGMAEEYGLDGIDLDWEHPKNPKEAADYAVLMKDLKKALGEKRLVTAALAGWQSLPKEGWDVLDRLHLMAYDHPERHSTFEAGVSDVAKVRAQGLAVRKIALGVPFYGRSLSEWNQALPGRELLVRLKGASGDEADGYFFNNLETLSRKAAWAKEQGLAGVMVWEMTQDTPDGRMMGALRETLLGAK